MIRFLYRCGTNETQERLTESIRRNLAAGEKALLLVPEQETVSVERRMLEALPASAQLSFEVLNFSRLANRVFRLLGGLSYRAASPATEALLMWQTLLELSPMLKQYGESAAKDPSFCDLMLSTQAQCKAYCISPDALLTAADKMEAGEPLKDKLTDIGLVLSGFDSALGARYQNTADDLTRLSELLSTKGKQVFGETHIYIDSFTDFTAQELSVLRALFSAAPSVTVTFPLLSPRDSGLHLVAPLATHRTLLRLANELGCEVTYEKPEIARPQTPSDFLGRYLFDMTAEPAPLAMCESGELSLTVCPTPFEEAKAAAATIHRLVRGGARYRDITVVVRDNTRWQGILDAALEREGIPFFLSEKTDITVRPLIKLILEALRICLYSWRHEDVVGYLKTGLCGIDQDDINLFEEYTSVWKPRGEGEYCRPFTKNPDGLKTDVSPRGLRILEAANRVREALCPPLLRFFKALNQAENAGEMCAALYDLLSDLSIAEQLKSEAAERLLAGERREAEELSRLYGVAVDALESISNAIGDRRLSIEGFADALKLVFSRTDIGLIPTSADEVTVGSASMLRTDHPSFVLVLGLNEGEFPRTVSDDGLVTDAEKQRLAELGVCFPGDTGELASKELFYLHRAFSAPRYGLFLSYSEFSTSSASLSPSLAISRVTTLFPQLTPLRFDTSDPLSYLYTPEGALEYFDELPQSKAEELRTLLEERGLAAAKALRHSVVRRDARITKETADTLFAQKRLSPTQIESFASCRFAYYCDKILGLRTEPDSEADYAVAGTFLHHVLEHAFAKMKRDGIDFCECEEAIRHQTVSEIATDYLEKLSAAGGGLSPRGRALIKRLSDLAEIVTTALVAEMKDSSFRPALLEFDLSTAGEQFAIKGDDGTAVALSGKADRVDLWRDMNGTGYLRVVDYKTGTRRFSLEDIDRGFSMQMPLYLHALCRSSRALLCRELGLSEDTPLRPAGVSYLSCAIGSESTETRKSREQALSDAAERILRDGLVLDDEAVLEALSHSRDARIVGGKSKSTTPLSGEDFDRLFDRLEATVTRISSDMKSGAAEARPQSQQNRSPCDFCRFGAICRAAQKTENK